MNADKYGTLSQQHLHSISYVNKAAANKCATCKFKSQVLMQNGKYKHRCDYGPSFTTTLSAGCKNWKEWQV